MPFFAADDISRLMKKRRAFQKAPLKMPTLVTDNFLFGLAWLGLAGLMLPKKLPGLAWLA